nr:hypothetical protein BaRGS_004079 [Batillaria attramentaria]
MCLYAVTMVFYSALNSVYGEKILIWLTYWSFYMVTARVTITSLNAWIFVFRTVRYQKRKSTHKSPPDRRVEEGSGLPVMYKLQWLLQNVSSCSAIIVSLLYWTLLYSGENSPTMISVNSHAVNSVFVLTDLLLSRAPIRIQHFIYTVVFFLVYVLFSIIYWAAGGQNHRGENYIYSLLDYSDKPGRAVAVNFAVVLVVCP